MMEIQGQDGSKAVVIEPGLSETVFGRGRGHNTQDRTVSRNHVLLRVNRPNPRATVSFEVVGRNPVWVLSRRGGEVRVYRNSEKGEVEVGDRFCVSGKKPVWFVLKGSAEEGAVGGGGEVDIQSDSEVDEGFEMDVSGIDPVKEFGFLVIGHEFDNYPKHRLRDVKSWDWFLQEPSKENDASDDESDEVRARSRRRRKRKKARDDAMGEDDEEWTGESEEHQKALQKASKIKKGAYWTRSRDPMKPPKNISSARASSSAQKKKSDWVAEAEDFVDEEGDDEMLGGFIVDDDDDEPEEDSDNEYEGEEEFVDDDDDDD